MEKNVVGSISGLTKAICGAEFGDADTNWDAITGTILGEVVELIKIEQQELSCPMDIIKLKSLLDYALDKDKYIALAKEVLQNYPTYSTEWAVCIFYDYDLHTYQFRVEDHGTITITAERFAESIPFFLNTWKFKKWGMYGSSPDTCVNEAGEWDQVILDAAIQFYCFQDLVFG